MLLADLAGDVRGDVPGCPEFSIRAALQKACVEFFYESRYWVQLIDPVTLVAGVTEYDLFPPSDTTILAIHNDGVDSAVMRGTCRVKVATEQQILARDRDATGAPQLCMLRAEDDMLVVWPRPTSDEAGDTLRIMVVLGAMRDITEVPDAIGLRWQEAFVCRAKARLMNTANKEWSNPDQGAMELRSFWNYVNNAKREGLTSRYAQPQMVRMRPFA